MLTRKGGRTESPLRQSTGRPEKAAKLAKGAGFLLLWEWGFPEVSWSLTEGNAFVLLRGSEALEPARLGGISGGGVPGEY